jgi:biotin operon repressor
VTGTVVLEALREGPKTTGELAEAVGVSRNAILCSIYYLAQAGYQIVNERPRGAHVEGCYRIAYDLEVPSSDRTCLICGKTLGPGNPGPYCRYDRRVMARLLLMALDAALDRMTEVTSDDGQQQLSIRLA